MRLSVKSGQQYWLGLGNCPVQEQEFQGQKKSYLKILSLKEQAKFRSTRKGWPEQQEEKLVS